MLDCIPEIPNTHEPFESLEIILSDFYFILKNIKFTRNFKVNPFEIYISVDLCPKLSKII